MGEEWLHPEDSGGPHFEARPSLTPYFSLSPVRCCFSTQPNQAAFPAPLPQPAVSGEREGRGRGGCVAEVNSGDHLWKVFNQSGGCDYLGGGGGTEVGPAAPDDALTTHFVGVGCGLEL